MRRHPRSHAWIIGLFAATTGIALAMSCSATNERNEFTGGDGGSGGTVNGSSSSGSGMGGEGGEPIILPDASDDAAPDVPINPCGSQCGPTELCDNDHTGLDDNCNGVVDEGCPCSTGQAHWCFKGDPSYHNTAGCYDGTEKCTEFGTWGPCTGGIHATDNCFSGGDPTGCHPIQVAPFADVNLKTGTGNFSMDAVPGTEVWTVACPPGVNPCPAVTGSNPPDDFKPLQSGEYTVTYTKGLAGGGMDSCQYPLFVGAPGLRVELEWEHNLGSDGVDLDLHVHQPNNTQPWGIGGVPSDCTWSNCTYFDFSPPQSFNAPDWFANVGMPPTPLDWYLDPIYEKNTCYFAPRGVGMQWASLGQGCHNPRLDLDNITCNPNSVDPNSFDFCAPENVNIDFPPTGEWIRVGVHYYSSHGLNYDVHPRIKIFCDGALGAELGPSGYFDPESPVTFTPIDGSSFGGNKFWLVGDVVFTEGMCQAKGCTVQPLYANPATKTPFFTTDNNAEANFGPPYPPLP